MRILVATVGTGRTREDIACAIALSAHTHTPDLLLCLPTEKTATETMSFVRAQLAVQRCRIEEHIVADEDDVRALYDQCREVITGLRRAHPDADVIVDFTSGTKPMSAALFAAAIAQRVAQISYVSGHRDDTGHVIDGMHVVGFPPGLVTADDDLRVAAKLFNARQFPAAAALTQQHKKDASLPEAYRARAAALCRLSTAYELWDRFEWRRAAHELGGTQTLCVGPDTPPPARLDAQRDYLHRCAGNGWPPERIAELAASAGRRAEEGRYDDAVARCYRAFEYVAQWRLATKHEFPDTAKIPVGRIPVSYRAELVRNPNASEIRLGLTEAYRLLDALEDPIGAAFKIAYVGNGDWRAGRGPLSGLLLRRNQSWLAHGTVPCVADVATRLREQLCDFGRRFVTNFEQDYETAQFVRWPVL